MIDAIRIERASRPVAFYLRPDQILRTLWRHGDLTRQMAWRLIVGRYRGSALGLLWSFILPLLMLVVYTFAFSVVLKNRWGNSPVEVPKTDFALILFAGLIFFNVFAECMSAAPNAVLANPSFVKKVVFPLEILPIVNLCAAAFNALLNLAILLLGIAIFQHRFPTGLAWLLLVFVPLAFTCLGLGWFLASVGVYLRDVGQVVTVVLQMLFFLTPLFYSIEQVPLESFRFAMRLNPLTVIIENARRVLMYDQPLDWAWLGVVTAMSFVIMQLGFAWFMKTKRGFADVV